jgi:hypothetical protein
MNLNKIKQIKIINQSIFLFIDRFCSPKQFIIWFSDLLINFQFFLKKMIFFTKTVNVDRFYQ